MTSSLLNNGTYYAHTYFTLPSYNLVMTDPSHPQVIYISKFSSNESNDVYYSSSNISFDPYCFNSIINSSIHITLIRIFPQYSLLINLIHAMIFNNSNDHTLSFPITPPIHHYLSISVRSIGICLQKNPFGKISKKTKSKNTQKIVR